MGGTQGLRHAVLGILAAQRIVHAGCGLTSHVAGDTDIGVVSNPIAIGVLAAQADSLHAGEGHRSNCITLRPVGLIVTGGALEAIGRVTSAYTGDRCRAGR